MTLAGIELVYLVQEIDEKTHGYYVNNIYGINRNSLLFKLHHPDKSDIMLMISSMGIWTSNKKIDPIEPNKLLRRLRNDLLRSKIEKIEQIGTERIAYLTFSNFENRFVLIVEFFGGGNILLCNYNKKILALMHSIDVRHRQLRVGLEYKPPPQDGIDVLDLKKENLKKILLVSTAVGKIIGRGLGLPKKYVEEIIRLSAIDRTKPSNELSSDEIDILFDVINTTISSVVKGQHDPTIITDGEESDVFPIRFSDDNTKVREVSSFNDGLDIIFTERILQTGKSLYSEEAEKIITELQNRLDEQKKAITTRKEMDETTKRIETRFIRFNKYSANTEVISKIILLSSTPSSSSLFSSKVGDSSSKFIRGTDSILSSAKTAKL